MLALFECESITASFTLHTHTHTHTHAHMHTHIHTRAPTRTQLQGAGIPSPSTLQALQGAGPGGSGFLHTSNPGLPLQLHPAETGAKLAGDGFPLPKVPSPNSGGNELTGGEGIMD